MIDIKVLRDDPETVRRSQAARGEDATLVDAILAADERRRSCLAQHEQRRAQQKTVSREVGTLLATAQKAAASGADAAELAEAKSRAQAARDTATTLSEQVKNLGAAVARAEGELGEVLRRVGNVIVPGVPAGGEDDYVVVETVGTPRDFPGEGFVPRDHLDLAEGLGAVDMARGVKVAQSRFYYLVGQGARLESALMHLALDAAHAHGFTQLAVPTLVNPGVMTGAGFLDAHAEEVYRLGQDDLYLTGTAEVAMAGYHADEIIDLSAGPRRYVALSTCYRREAGSYGKDTRGIIRVHQFQKVEMFVFCRPLDAQAEHARLLGWEKDMLDRIEIPYRVIDVAAGDLGGPAARKYDCEGWVPTQGRYRELTSTSNCTTYQARRLNIRERVEAPGEPAGRGGTATVATLNGTLATSPRWLVALLENHQSADGSVWVPAALQPYLRTERLVPGGR
ncbi:MAG TPA: serine--tRNA ligase [Dermatophilaceae bacterium]|nr:serine--tRNA ligase [Dermatophilaceae bacterium]